MLQQFCSLLLFVLVAKSWAHSIGSSYPAMCHPSEFYCIRHQIESCIPQEWVCDDYNDCDNGGDEESCESSVSTPQCLGDDFMCLNGDCIPELWACDGDNDCEQGEDEADSLCQATPTTEAASSEEEEENEEQEDEESSPSTHHHGNTQHGNTHHGHFHFRHNRRRHHHRS